MRAASAASRRISSRRVRHDRARAVVGAQREESGGDGLTDAMAVVLGWPSGS